MGIFDGAGKENFRKFPSAALREEGDLLLFSLSQISYSKRCQQERKQLLLELSSHSHVPGFNVLNMW